MISSQLLLGIANFLSSFASSREKRPRWANEALLLKPTTTTAWPQSLIGRIDNRLTRCRLIVRSTAALGHWDEGKGLAPAAGFDFSTSLAMVIRRSGV